jgi:ABC-2 type transport system permease protein
MRWRSRVADALTGQTLLHRSRRLARIYARLQLLQLRTVVEYRADFWIGIVGAALMHGAGLLFIVALFGQIDELQGWTAWEVAILYALCVIPQGLRELFCDGPWLMRGMVNKGEFDRLLVRPISPALQVATSLASIHGIGQVTLGVIAFWLGATRSGLEWTWWKPLYLLIILLSSTILVTALGFLVNLIGFWEPSAQSAFPTAYVLLGDFVKFPLDLYSAVIKVLVVVVAPYAFVSYFPALVLFEKDSAWRWLGWGSPIVTSLVCAITAWLWRVALNRYQGVGH